MAYMKDLTGARLDAFKVQGAKASNVATRIIGGRMGTFDASTAKTFHLALETSDDFDAVRIIFASTDRTNSYAMLSCAASVSGSKADLNNSAGTWVAGGRQGSAQVFAELAPSGTDRVTFTLSDWIPLPSVPRTDGGTKPLVFLRAYMSGTSTLPVYGNGTDDFTNWATRTDGRLWAARYQDGDHATTQTGFTSTTNRSQTPIVGVQYLARGQVVTVAAVGDSITEGQGTYLGQGFILPALEALSASGSTKFEYMNCGWSGQSMDRFTERAIDLMESEVRPDVIVFPAASPNDVPTTITAADITAFRARKARIIAAARDNDVVPVVWTWLPTNTAVRPYGSTDALRVAYNAEILAQANRNIIVADTATALSGATSGGQVQMTGQTDGIHPNDAGNTTLSAVVQPALLAASRQQQGGNRRAPARTASPVFATTESTLQVSKAGVWIYRGGGSGIWTLPPLSAGVRQDSQVITIRVRESSGAVQVQRNGTDAINYGGSTGSSLVVNPGEAATFVPSGNGTWDVLGVRSTDSLKVKRDTAATLTLDRTTSLYVFAGTTATVWTLPTARFTGQRYTIKNAGTANITLNRGGSDTIFSTVAGATSVTIAPGESIQIAYDGTIWVVL